MFVPYRLEKRGWVERNKRPTDDRALSLRLSEQGRVALHDMDGEVNKINTTIDHVLTPTEVQTLNDLLRRCAVAVEDDLRTSYPKDGYQRASPPPRARPCSSSSARASTVCSYRRQALAGVRSNIVSRAQRSRPTGRRAAGSASAGASTRCRTRAGIDDAIAWPRGRGRPGRRPAGRGRRRGGASHVTTEATLI